MTAKAPAIKAPPPSAEAAVTSRNLLGGAVFKCAQIAAAVLFAVIVPRMMGPTYYGEFALLIAIIAIFGAITNFAITDIFGRFFPEFITQRQYKQINKLFTNFLFFKTSITVTLSIVLFVIIFLAYQDRFSLAILITVPLIVIAADWVSIFYAVLYGFNKISIFSTQEPVQRLLSVTLIVLLFQRFGLTGSVTASFLATLIMLAFSIILARRYIDFEIEKVDFSFLSPFLKFGVTLSVAWLIQNVWRNSGTFLVDLITSDTEAVAFFDIGQRIQQVGSSITIISINSLVPIFTTLLLSSKTEKIEKWSRRITCYTAVVNIIGVSVFTVFGFDLLRLGIGNEYGSVYPVALLLLLSLFPMILVQIGFVHSVVGKKPYQYLAALVIAVVSFMLVSIILVPRLSAIGCALSNLIAYLIMAGYIYASFKTQLRDCLLDLIKVLAIGVVLSPILFIPAGRLLSMATLAAFILTFVCSLFTLRLLKFGELQEIIMAIGKKKS